MGRLFDRKAPLPDAASGEAAPNRSRPRPHELRDRNPALPQYKKGGFRAKEIGRIDYRSYRPGDEHSILDGFNETFKLDRGLDYWHWKFAGEPFARFISVAVDEDGMVLAFYAAVPLHWQYDGVLKLAGLGADVYCRRHPDLIRRGVFIETLNHFLDSSMGGDGLSIVFGFAGRTASRLYQHKTPYIGPHPIELFERGAADPGATGSEGPFRAVYGAAAVEILETLWPRVALRHPRIALRDAAWARRRFVDRPDMSYVTLALVDDTGVPAAWGVYTVRDDALYACDAIWDGRPGALEQLDAIFGAAAEEAKAARSLMVLHNGAEVAETFRARGWSPTEFPHGGSWIMQTADPDIGEDILHSFYLTYADTDLI